jgi:hypothetical protein
MIVIPDQRKQGEAYCASRRQTLAENDRRREFQRMTGAGTSKPAPFDVVVVHSFSRFFRDHFELECAGSGCDEPSLYGGEGGIRTPDRLAPMPHFECGAFDHSATSPKVPRRRRTAFSAFSSEVETGSPEENARIDTLPRIQTQNRSRSC